MVSNNNKSERIKLNVLGKLDKLPIHRKMSYSTRIALLLEYCGLDKRKLNAWLRKKESENERK